MKKVYTLAEINTIAKQLLAQYNTATVFAFTAEMGAGKTTLINAMCSLLGVTEPTSSPTYAIVNEYKGSRNHTTISIYHQDWYRLKDANDVLQTGAIEYFTAPNSICFVEWPNVAKRLLPSTTVFISIQLIDEHKREIVVV